MARDSYYDDECKRQRAIMEYYMGPHETVGYIRALDDIAIKIRSSILKASMIPTYRLRSNQPKEPHPRANIFRNSETSEEFLDQIRFSLYAEAAEKYEESVRLQLEGSPLPLVLEQTQLLGPQKDFESVLRRLNFIKDFGYDFYTDEQKNKLEFIYAKDKQFNNGPGSKKQTAVVDTIGIVSVNEYESTFGKLPTYMSVAQMRDMKPGSEQ